MIPNQVVLSVLGCQDLLAAEVGTEYVFVVSVLSLPIR